MKNLTIGQLAKKAQVNIETVRYYERRGLLPEPPRKDSGYRQYSENDVSRLLFIKRAQTLGFTLKEILELLSLRVDPNTTCGDVKRRAEAKIADIEEKTLALKKMKKALTKLAATCKGRGPTSECPILEMLNSEDTGGHEEWKSQRKPN
jgi:MerR family mercuric resistance operon transcriptional regulator